MTPSFPASAPAPKARVLSNMYLPAAEGYAIRCFGEYLPPLVPGAPAPAPWRAEMERRDLADILPLIPTAEKPDILLCASPEYLPIPWDIHTFAGPKVLLITDWNVCLRFLPDLCKLFDFCFTDWPGYRLLRRAGVANVFHQPLFGHDPERFRILPAENPAAAPAGAFGAAAGAVTGAVPGGLGRVRDLDVSFCGNLNAGLHGERNRLLARVARWAHRTGRPVHLRQAFDDAYVDILNRSRLVFNYSIRGEANMRLFEAMACGAVPLVEETNQEVAILFQEGRHYFRYPLGGLEAKLDELLARPERIAEVAEAAQREVGRHAKARQLASLLDRVCGGDGSGTILAQGATIAPRVPQEAPAASRKALAKIRVLGMGYTAPEAMGEIQARAADCPGLDLEALPGLLSAVASRSEDRASGQARIAFDHLLGRPGIPEFLRLFFRLQEARRVQAWDLVEGLARQCRASLDRAEAPQLAPGGALYSVLLHPVDLGKGMNSDINRAYREDLATHGASGAAGPAGAGGLAGPTVPAGRRLLERHCAFALAEAALARGRASEALAISEGLGTGSDAMLARHRLSLDATLVGRALHDTESVRRVCQAWFAEFPLDTSAWERIVDGMGRIGDVAGRMGFLQQFHEFALYFLDAEQAASIKRLIESQSAPAPDSTR